MIKTIVKIYPNEIVYSWLSRIYVRSGYGSKDMFLRHIYKIRKYPDLLFIGGLNVEFLKAIKSITSIEDLLINHTLFKYYVRFLDLDRRKRLYQMVLNNEDGISISIPDDKIKNNYSLRYCPICVNEDRSNYGECYFHTEHQFPKINICTKHKCRLKSTDIKITEYRKKTFVPLEEVVDDLNVEHINVNSMEFKIAKYINELFFIDIDMLNDYKISMFLNLNLKHKYFRYNEALRDNQLLIKDLMLYYKDVEGYTMNLNKLQPILCGHNWNPYEISLLSLFEEITPKELSKFSLGIKNKKIQMDKLDEEYCERFEFLVKEFTEIDKLKINRKWVSEQLQIPMLRIRYPYMPKLCKKISDFKGCKCDWNKLDKEYCEKVEKLVKTSPELFVSQKITKKYIGSILEVRNKSLRMFPMLTKKVYQLERRYNGREYYHK